MTGRQNNSKTLNVLFTTLFIYVVFATFIDNSALYILSIYKSVTITLGGDYA